MILDYMRGTRVNRDGSSSRQLMSQLKMKHFQRNVRMSLWHNPDTGYLKGRGSNGPLREIWGVHHIKAHVFDNHVMLTGANLSEDYFTDRQDRCMIIQDCEPLADYFDDLISVLGDLSFTLDESGDLKMLPHYAEPYKDAKKYKNQMSHHLRFFRFSNRSYVATDEDELEMDRFFGGYDSASQVDDSQALLTEDHLRSREGTKRKTQQDHGEFEPLFRADDSSTDISLDEQVLLGEGGLN